MANNATSFLIRALSVICVSSKLNPRPLKQPKRLSISSEARMLQWLFQVIQLLQQLTVRHQPILNMPGKQGVPTQTVCLVTTNNKMIPTTN